MKIMKFLQLFPIFLMFSMLSCASAKNTKDSFELGSTTAPKNTINGFGMGSATAYRNGYSYEMDEAYKTLNEVGVSFIREEITVKEISDLSDQRKMIEAAKENNLTIVGLLTYGFDFYSDDNDFFERWDYAIDKIVKELGYGIDYWEIGNEMNCIKFWRKVRPGTLSVEINIYAEMLNRAYKIIKKYNPNDTVILGGLIASADFENGYDPTSFLRNARKYWDKPPFDAVGLHTYWGSAFPETDIQNFIDEKIVTGNMADYIESFNKAIQEIFRKEYPIWITEVGYKNEELSSLNQSYDNYDENGLQAIGLIRTYTILLSTQPVEKVFWYTYSPDHEDVYVINKTSLNVLKNLSSAITNTKPLGRFPVIDALGREIKELYDYRFLRDDGQTISIFWSNDSTEPFVQATINHLSSNSVNLFDIEKGIESKGTILQDAEIKFRILNAPAFLLGKMNDSTRIVVDNETGIRPLIYTKEGNIYSYDPENDIIQALTDNGDLSWENSYYNPLLSTDSQFVAVETRSSFIILDLQGNVLESWEKTSKPDIMADTLVGWDYQNNLYFTRTIGDCIITDNKIIGPDHVELIRLNPQTEDSETITDLARLDDASHAYSIGHKISFDGKYLAMINGACSVGLSDKLYYMNIESGKVIQDTDYLRVDPYNDDQFPVQEDDNYIVLDKNLSPDHNYIAYIRMEKLNNEASDLGGEYFSFPEETSTSELIITSTKNSQDKIIIDDADSVIGWSSDQSKLAYIEKDSLGELYPNATLKILDLTESKIITIDNGQGIDSTGW